MAVFPNVITVTCMSVEGAQGLVVGTGDQTVPHPACWEVVFTAFTI